MDEQAPGNIRLATVDDLPRIHEIAVAGWLPIFTRYRHLVGEKMWDDVWGGWDQDWFRLDAESWHGRGIVTEVDGQVAGFATWSGVNDILAEVGGNAVDPEYQGRGIGTAQIRWVVEHIRDEGHRCVKVHTGMDPAHGPARAAYRQAGLRRGVTSSVYLNYLEEVARLPVRDSLRFRWATPSDAEDVRQVVKSAWEPVYQGVRQRLGHDIFMLAFENVLARRSDELATTVRESPEKVRVVEEGHLLEGVAVIDQEEGKRLGIIDTVAVTTEAQGRGIGAGLCMDAFDIIRERGQSYARLRARLGEVTERTRQMCWNVGLYRELPSIDYYVPLWRRDPGLR